MQPTPPTPPQVTVIICHHTGRELLRRTLQSVQRSVGVSYHVRVITSDATMSAADNLLFRQEFSTGDNPVIFFYEEGGPAHKRNYGVVHGGLVKSKYLVFLDDDVIIGVYTLYELFMNMEEHLDVGFGFCKIYNAERRKEFDDCGSFLSPTGFLWARAGNAQLDKGQYDTAEPILSSKSATCIIRKDLFLKVGGFAPDFYFLAEETQLAYKVWLSGSQVWYFPSAHSWHYFNTSQKPKETYYSLRKIHFLGSRNYLLFLLTCLGTSRLLAIIPIHWTIWWIAVIGFLLRGEWKRAFLISEGLLYPICHPRVVIKKRRQVQSLRIRSDKEIFQYGFRCPSFSYYAGRMRRYLTQQTHG